MATSEPLTKVDSAVDSTSHAEEKKPSHRRTSSSATNVFNINDLEKEGVDLKIAVETQQLGWKINTSPATLDDKEALKKPLCTPMVKKIDLRFPLGLEVTARNLKGVTIKDACDAIFKAYKKKTDDELENPYLAGFEWDKEEFYTKFIVHLKKEASKPAPSGKKSKKKGGDA